MLFRDKTDFIFQIETDNAWNGFRLWCEKHKTLEKIIEYIPYEHHIWCISKNYQQFIDSFDFNNADLVDLKAILIARPELSDKIQSSKNWKS